MLLYLDILEGVSYDLSMAIFNEWVNDIPNLEVYEAEEYKLDR